MISSGLLMLSTFFFFAGFGFSGIAVAVGYTGNETDRLALLAFKADITEDPLGVLGSWNASDIHFCEWRGVTCGRLHQRVTELNLGSSKLTGSISPYIGNLSFLRGLNLDDNNFGYFIPPQISNLRRLQHLWLLNNSLVGKIPNNLSACSNLLTFRVTRNKLDGVIPSELGSLSKLTYLSVGYNELTGGIPSSFGNLSSLVTLFATSNKLTGNIPSTLGKLTNLVNLALAINMLSGTIPPSIFNLSSIAAFDIELNQFHGVLPSDLGNTLTNINFFAIGSNKFSGPIPVSLSNASDLTKFLAATNNFTGEVPRFENLSKLSWLVLTSNQLGHGERSSDLSFFPSLINCTNLVILALNHNNLGGIFPISFLNLSTTLATLWLEDNHISGNIPSGLEKFVNLINIDISYNRISGTIPPDIGKLQNLQGLTLQENHLSGNIPSSFGNLSRLVLVIMDGNNLQGNIPSTLGNCRNLNLLILSRNNLSGTIPSQILGLTSLTLLLDLSHNHLTGPLPPQVGQLKNLGALYISDNMLSGNIPTTIGSCTLLEDLDIQGNFFRGKIPPSFSALKGLQILNLARNNFSGLIPDFLGEFKLQYLNLSFNNFEGELPTKGVFKNASAVFINGNMRLCGGVPELKLPLCISTRFKKESNSATYKILVLTILAVLGPSLVLCLFLFCWLRKKRLHQALESSDDVHSRVSYQALLTATDGFSSSNMIGSGGFGTVYRGCFEDKSLVAIKVLNLDHRAAARSFIAECEAFRNIRHRNLVKLLTVCSSIDYQGNDFKAVVYQLMVNGNLDEWLHPVQTEDKDQNQQRRCLNLLDRLNIAIDVASALNYLHNDCQPPIVHCDIKPSNVLLDNELTGHVGDFGLARFVIEKNSSAAIQTSSVDVKGSIGYTPPEYGLGSEKTTSGDVYSYGILLLEMMTGKRPTDSMFQEGLNLHTFAQMALPNRVKDIVDIVFLNDKEELKLAASSRAQRPADAKREECLISAVKIGVACSMDSPKDRKSIRDVVRELHILRDLL